MTMPARRTLTSVTNRLTKALRGDAPAPASAAQQTPGETPAVFPWRAAAEVADSVGTVLAGLGVEHWTVQPLMTRITVWAVRATDWPAVLSGLVDALGGQGLQLQVGKTSTPLEEGGSLADSPAPASVTVVRPVVDGCTGQLSLDAACELQLWQVSAKGTLRTSEKSGVIHELPNAERIETVPSRRWDGAVLPRPAVLARPDSSEIDFDVDAVYLWVDDADPAWQERREATRHRLGLEGSTALGASHQFRDRGELRASLRSLEMYAPWIRRIFLVTDQQRPDWLDRESSRVTVVDHREVFSDPSVLPSFNSHAISSQLHRIDGLASRYLYMNDDVMFNRAVTPYDFFTSEGLLKVVFSRSKRPLLGNESLSALQRARANAAALIERDHGKLVTRLFAHVAIPQSLEIAREVEELYATEIAANLSHPFRSPDDFEVNCWLHLHRALFTGRAAVYPMRFAYFDVGSASNRKAMDDLAAQARALVLCVNDVVLSDDIEEVSAWLSGWLARRFPTPVDHELADEARGQE